MLVLMTMTFTVTSCDKTEHFPAPEKKELIKSEIYPAFKNSFQKTVDSLVYYGKLQVGEPFSVKRYPGDDVTYIMEEGYSWRGTTTKKYVQENNWYTSEKYIDANGYYYIMFHHNNHNQYAVKTALFPVYKFNSFKVGDILTGDETFKILDDQFSGKWDPEIKPAGR